MDHANPQHSDPARRPLTNVQPGIREKRLHSPSYAIDVGADAGLHRWPKCCNSPDKLPRMEITLRPIQPQTPTKTQTPHRGRNPESETRSSPPFLYATFPIPKRVQTHSWEPKLDTASKVHLHLQWLIKWSTSQNAVGFRRAAKSVADDVRGVKAWLADAWAAAKWSFRVVAACRRWSQHPKLGKKIWRKWIEVGVAIEFSVQADRRFP